MRFDFGDNVVRKGENGFLLLAILRTRVVRFSPLGNSSLGASMTIRNTDPIAYLGCRRIRRDVADGLDSLVGILDRKSWVFKESIEMLVVFISEHYQHSDG